VESIGEVEAEVIVLDSNWENVWSAR
jgi:hypothetical protein